MMKKYNIIEVLNSEVGTQFKDEIGVLWVVITKHNSKYLVANDSYTTLNLNSTVLNMKFEKVDEVNWNKVPRGTRIQVRDCDGQKWKNGYFISYLGDIEKYPFKISFMADDDFVGFNLEESPAYYKKCRLYPTNDNYKNVLIMEDLLNKLGINIRQQSGEYKSFNKILQEVANKWDGVINKEGLKNE